MTEPRIAPLDPPYSAPVAAALERIMPAGVPPLALFRTLAVNERVFLRVMAGGLLDRGSITLREREIVIDRDLRPLRLRVRVGRARGLLRGARAPVAGRKSRARAPSPRTARLPRASGCSSASSTSSTTRPRSRTRSGQALAAEWTAEQLIELIALAGFYHLISFMTNALRIPREAYGARFPAGERA